MSKHTLPKRRRPAAPCPGAVTPAARAAMLDRLADAELQHGHHAAAEQLARRAAAMREVAQ